MNKFKVGAEELLGRNGLRTVIGGDQPICSVGCNDVDENGDHIIFDCDDCNGGQSGKCDNDGGVFICTC